MQWTISGILYIYIYLYAYHICRETDDFTIRTSIWLGISQPCLMTPWPCRHHVQVIEVHAPGDATVQLAFQETSPWYREPWQKGPYVDIFQFWAKYVRIYIIIYILYIYLPINIYIWYRGNWHDIDVENPLCIDNVPVETMFFCCTSIQIYPRIYCVYIYIYIYMICAYYIYIYI